MAEGLKTEAVIFDLDGTLLDTLEDLKDAVNAALEQYGMPVRTMDEIRCFIGNGIRKLMVRSVPDGEENPSFEAALDYFKTYYRQHCNEKTIPYEGVMELIEELSLRGIKMGIVSNKFDAGVKLLNEAHFAQYIKVAIGEVDGVKRKPDPESVHQAVNLLQVDKIHTIYVGDSDVDILTAKNAGMRSVSVTWGFRDENFLKAHGAECLIHQPMELLEYI